MISYTLERRADTGVSNASLGLWLFLASEVMLFGALFSSYALLRVSAVEWPSGHAILSWRLGGINTAILLIGTAILWRSRLKSVIAGRRALLCSSVLAIAFLAVKGGEYRGEIARGLIPSASTFAALYFTLTGLHALHVFGGLVANMWALAGRAGDAMTGQRIQLLSIYWTFVDLVWIVIFLLMYVA